MQVDGDESEEAMLRLALEMSLQAGTPTSSQIDTASAAPDTQPPPAEAERARLGSPPHISDVENRPKRPKRLSPVWL